MRFDSLILLLILITPVFLGAQETGVYHESPDSLPNNQTIELKFIVIANFTDITWVNGFFRTDTSAAYREKSLRQNRKGMYVLPIAPEELTGDTLYYFVATHLDDGRMFSWPPDDPEANPRACPLYGTRE
ncbi:MAG: hypothetical protein K9N46_01250 [Candidatus Marinimicrobia bacterium]|nr:hypothetical protein [Candidatus Neomarinimicrobiota bacterium]MCF7827898.1 hypothetical protein [Candidatus Neomarinimicrobiota bacterium]MCF7879347.1 hypothetical protein [Candidatus Neomarinimicrobiota bacterium]